MWLVTLTERVHLLRLQLPVRWADPEWVKMVDLTPQSDAELFRMRARFASSHPGMEIS
jgi:hypothetical protein